VIPASSETILIAARQVLAHRVHHGALLQSPQKAGEYLTARLGHLDYEVFGLILLDKRHRVIECEVVKVSTRMLVDMKNRLKPPKIQSFCSFGGRPWAFSEGAGKGGPVPVEGLLGAARLTPSGSP
jgi:RadC-like JAB domain